MSSCDLEYRQYIVHKLQAISEYKKKKKVNFVLAFLIFNMKMVIIVW
jgi:hypothetical protein